MDGLGEFGGWKVDMIKKKKHIVMCMKFLKYKL